MDDCELLRRYVEERSEAAFAELVRRRIGLVYGVALRRTRSASMAEDVAQKVFASLARKAKSLARRPVIAGWLYRSAQFAATDALRTEMRRQAREMKSAMTQDTPGPEWEKARPLLDEVLNGLNARDRDAVLLRFMEKLPFAEIGEKISLTENSARMRVDRAVEKMRAALARRGIHSTAAALAAALADETAVAAPAYLAASVAAVATSSATTAAGLTFFAAMNTIKMTALTTVAAIAAAGVAIHESNSARQSSALAENLTRERDALRQQLDASVKTASAPASPEKTCPASVQPESLKTLAHAATINAGADKEDALRLATYRQRLDGFIRQRQLSPDQAEKLCKILNEWDHISRDFQTAVREQGLPDNAEIDALRARLQKEFEVSPLDELLGPDGRTAYYAYERFIYYRAFVDPAIGQLASQGIPLSDEQTAKLVALVKANDNPQKQSPYDIGNRSQINWPTVLDRAGAILSPAQLQVLKNTWGPEPVPKPSSNAQ